jgi:hypothetical protein
MNLLEYIKERRLLDRLNTHGIHRNYNVIRKIYSQTNIERSELTIDSFDKCIDFLEDELAGVNKKLEETFLKEIQPPRLKQSYTNYENKRRMDIELISDDHWTEEFKRIVCSKMKKYVDFQYPGCEIGPRSHYWTKELGGFDPLYLVGPDLNMIQHVADNFNPIYQRRLRIYQLEDSMDFSYLPQKAFAFVFSLYHFEFLPYDMIDKYLAGIFNILSPGGIAFLTYANCLMEKSAEKFENSYYCYMTNHLMEGLANKNGFDIMEQEDFQFRMSWVIVQKPGKFQPGIKRVPSVGFLNDGDVPEVGSHIKEEIYLDR